MFGLKPIIGGLFQKKKPHVQSLETEIVDFECMVAELEAEQAQVVANNYLEDEKSSEEKEEQSFNEDTKNDLCQRRRGKITQLYPNYGLIDDSLYFGLTDIPTTNYRVGDHVVFIAYRRRISEEWRVHKILSVENEPWENEPDINGVILESRETTRRTHVCRVVKRRDRDIIVTPDLRFRLDEVKADFTPLEGDWLQLDVFAEVDPSCADGSGDILAVDRVKALRCKALVGGVTTWDLAKGEGVVDGEIYFSKDACESGYMPCRLDRAIESEQKTLAWRALNVSPQTEKDNNSSTRSSSNKQMKSLLANKKGMVIKDNLSFGVLQMGEEKEIGVEVFNNSGRKHLLLGGRFVERKGADYQVSLICPNMKNPIILMPSESVIYRFHAKGTILGHSSELFVFKFKGFDIGRYLDVEVEEESQACLSTVQNPAHVREKYDRCALARKMQESHKKGFLISGVRPIKPPAFVPVRLGMYPIPDRLWAAVLGVENATRKLDEVLDSCRTTVPCLLQSLSMDNYCTRMHALLYLEEIEYNLRMRQYDMEKAEFSFVKGTNGRLLSLAVPGLAEKRPSLMLGDRVIAISTLQTDAGAALQFEGFIHKVCSQEVWLKFNANFHALYNGGSYSVSFHFSRTPMRRCHAAVDLALNHMGVGMLFPKCVKVQKPQLYFTEDNFDGDSGNMPCPERVDSEEEDLPPRVPGLHQHRQAPEGARNGHIDIQGFGPGFTRRRRYRTLDSLPCPEPPKSQDHVVKLKWLNQNLNQQQKDAVRNVLRGEARPLPYVIFGPPGTGKTITVVEAVLQIFLLVADARIIVATPSNSSANLIAERLLESNLLQPGDLVRLVGYHCIEEGTLPQCLLNFATTGDIRIARGEASLPTPVCENLKTSSNASTLGRHRITVGTCIALGQLYTMGFPRGHFTHVLVDEAGQATEPEILIPLGFLHTGWGQAVLAGDPLQLGPVVASRVASHYGLGESFLSRLLARFPYERDPQGYREYGGYNPRLVTRLVMNYRSLPEILKLPSDLFYDGQLEPQVSTETSLEADTLRKMANILPKRKTQLPPAVVFHGIRGTNYQDGSCPSWFNPQEVVQVANYLKSIFESGMNPDEVGVITPYQRQVQKLRSLLIRMKMPIPKIGSVEEFQGQERLVIILSAVRSSPKQLSTDLRHALGFVASPRRLNVALTRARCLLIIIGNPHLLARDPFWRSSLLYCLKNDSYIGCDLPNDILQK
ncbi:Probable RNA helicase armi [Gryllus bimaculatus]|nr:Probable RNA helicase armi [Gryllus bimaculatus]